MWCTLSVFYFILAGGEVVQKHFQTVQSSAKEEDPEQSYLVELRRQKLEFEEWSTLEEGVKTQLRGLLDSLAEY